jgi:peptidoglycan/LPS O-acetylase OafA/YrhL
MWTTLSALAAPVLVLEALAIAALLARRDPALASASASHRFATLDGLRGLLALCVVLHHAFVWFHYAHGQGWQADDSRLFLHFGQTGVALFFMLTAFLFVGRVLDARARGDVDWLQFYVSRVLRLTPAYWLAMVLMLGVLALATTWHVDGAGDGVVQRGWPDIVSASAVWFGFTMLGRPAIDAYLNTPSITAAVTWSLAYEWSFYLVLPLVAVLLRASARMPAWALLVGLGGALWIGISDLRLALAWPFLGGGVAALLVRQPRFVAFAQGRLAGAIAVAALVSVVLFAAGGNDPLALVGSTLAFSLVAGGNSLSGLLTLRAARALGAMGYSLYLLHGIVLYTLWMLVLGVERTSALTPFQHWAIVAAVLPPMLLLSHASWRWVELPAIRAVPGVVARLRRASATRGNVGEANAGSGLKT